MPTITKNLIIINLLCYLAGVVAERYGINLNDVLGLHFFMAPDFRFYQFFTYMFMHGNLQHIFFNMFAVWMFGRVMESYWGPRRFLTYYIVCGVGAGIVQEITQYGSYLWQGLDMYTTVNIGKQLIPMAEYLNLWTTVGASGAVYGILLAFGMMFPDERMFVFPLPVPIRAKFFVVGYAAIELLMALSNKGDGIAHFAHLGGMVFGLLLIWYWRANGGGGTYCQNKRSVLKTIKKWFDDKFSVFSMPKMKTRRGGRFNDYDYNARKNAESEEIDKILEKVKKDGYQSLTEAEKRKLFDASRR